MVFNYLRVNDKFIAIHTESFGWIMHDAFWIIWHIVGLAIITLVKSRMIVWLNVVKINPNIIIPVRPLMFMHKSNYMQKFMNSHCRRIAVFVNSKVHSMDVSSSVTIRSTAYRQVRTFVIYYSNIVSIRCFFGSKWKNIARSDTKMLKGVEHQSARRMKMSFGWQHF